MKILTTEHVDIHAIDTKGQALGRVGIFIVVGLISLFFATTLIMVQASVDNVAVRITQNNQTLTANTDYEEADLLNLNYAWFQINANYDASRSNTKVLADKCKEMHAKTQSHVTSGSGSSVTIDSNGYNNLYCFAVSTVEDGEVSHTDYGGYIPTQ